MRRRDRRRGQELEREVTIGDGTIEFAMGAPNPSAAAVAARSIGKLVPASAAAPSGHSFSRTRASARRPRSRPNIST